MRAQIRIVAGQLRGRKLACEVSPELRPTPDMVREALFSILGNAVPDRTFVDIFAGSGVMGMEALSRGAKQTLFIEHRDVRLARDIEGHLRRFDMGRKARIYRTDAYRWVSAWQPPSEPVNVFVSPPFADLEERPDALIGMMIQMQEKVATESVLNVQVERDTGVEKYFTENGWEKRKYGRNVLFLWQKEEAVAPPATESTSETEPKSQD